LRENKKERERVSERNGKREKASFYQLGIGMNDSLLSPSAHLSGQYFADVTFQTKIHSLITSIYI